MGDKSGTLFYRPFFFTLAQKPMENTMTNGIIQRLPRTLRGRRRAHYHGFTMIEIMIVLGIFGIIIAIAAPTWLRQRENSRSRACQENLAKIDGAKEQWALENRLSNGTTVPSGWLSNTDICGPNGYIKREPNCPSGGTYIPNEIGSPPSCSYYGSELYGMPKHIIQQ